MKQFTLSLILLIILKLSNYLFAQHVCYKDDLNCREKSNIRCVRFLNN